MKIKRNKKKWSFKSNRIKFKTIRKQKKKINKKYAMKKIPKIFPIKFE